MSWYQKPKQPADPVVAPGRCVICGETGSVQLSDSFLPQAHGAIPASLWICRRCADEHRDQVEAN